MIQLSHIAIRDLRIAQYDILRHNIEMRSTHGMRPQDILVLLKLLVNERGFPKVLNLAYELGLSQSEISMSLERSRIAGLLDANKRIPRIQALREFILFGLKYVFPAEPGSVVRGLPTAHSALPLSKRIVADSKDSERFVWPDSEGIVRGIAIEPLYPSVPSAAKKDGNLYEALALIDALRVGKVRERKIAVEELEARFFSRFENEK